MTVRMDPQILKIFPNIGEEDLDLLHAPAKTTLALGTSKSSETASRQTVHSILIGPYSYNELGSG